MLNQTQFVESYYTIGYGKTQSKAWRTFVLGILAGFLIAMGGVVTNTASHAITNPSVAKIVCGLLFPFGLVMVILMGAELFTGNVLITIPVLGKKATLKGMLKNWGLVYCGNFVGSVLTSSCCAYFGQMNLNNGALAVATMKTAAAKCSLGFGNAFVLGIFCNILVCIAVMQALSSKETIGRFIGAYVPIAFFVIAGFEHSVANMFYITAGLFAKTVPAYAQLAAEAGLDLTNLTWGSFLLNNLLPVTLGNIVGGLLVACLVYFCFAPKEEKKD